MEAAEQVFFQNYNIPSAPLDPGSDQGSDTGLSTPLWFLTPLCCCLSARWPSRALLQSKVDPGPSSPPWAAPCRGRSPLPLPSHFPSITLTSAPADPLFANSHLLSWNSRILCQGKSIRATHALSASFRVRLWGVNPDRFGVHSVSFWWLSELFPHL